MTTTTKQPAFSKNSIALITSASFIAFSLYISQTNKKRETDFPLFGCAELLGVSAFVKQRLDLDGQTEQVDKAC